MTTKIEINDIVHGKTWVETPSIIKIQKNRTGYPEGANTMIACTPKNGIDIFYNVTESVDEVNAMIAQAKEVGYAEATH